MPVPMNKLRVATFHHYIIIGGAAVCFLITELIRTEHFGAKS